MSEDDRLYLQFLQNNIARMNTNSVQAKGWCIAIVAALFAIFADTNNLLFVYILLEFTEISHQKSSRNNQ